MNYNTTPMRSAKLESGCLLFCFVGGETGANAAKLSATWWTKGLPILIYPSIEPTPQTAAQEIDTHEDLISYVSRATPNAEELHPTTAALLGHCMTGDKGRSMTFREINGWYSHQPFRNKPAKFHILNLKTRPSCRLQKTMKGLRLSREDTVKSGRSGYVQATKISTLHATSR